MVLIMADISAIGPKGLIATGECDDIVSQSYPVYICTFCCVSIMLGAFSALIIVMLRPQTEVATVDQDCHQSILYIYEAKDHCLIIWVCVAL